MADLTWTRLLSTSSKQHELFSDISADSSVRRLDLDSPGIPVGKQSGTGTGWLTGTIKWPHSSFPETTAALNFSTFMKGKFHWKEASHSLPDCRGKGKSFNWDLHPSHEWLREEVWREKETIQAVNDAVDKVKNTEVCFLLLMSSDVSDYCDDYCY